MDGFEVDEELAKLPGGEEVFAHFFRTERLSLTVARWAAGALDSQTPHAEDEVYYVVRGRASITVSGETRAVRAGSVVYVAAGTEHRFHDVEEGLEVLVFWAPARQPTT